MGMDREDSEDAGGVSLSLCALHPGSLGGLSRRKVLGEEGTEACLLPRAPKVLWREESIEK